MRHYTDPHGRLNDRGTTADVSKDITDPLDVSAYGRRSLLRSPRPHEQMDSNAGTSLRRALQMWFSKPKLGRRVRNSRSVSNKRQWLGEDRCRSGCPQTR